jgi:hypothetical protein
MGKFRVQSLAMSVTISYMSQEGEGPWSVIAQARNVISGGQERNRRRIEEGLRKLTPIGRRRQLERERRKARRVLGRVGVDVRERNPI